MGCRSGSPSLGSQCASRPLEQRIHALPRLGEGGYLEAAVRRRLRRSRHGIRHGRRHHRQGSPPRTGRKRGTQSQAIGRSKGGMTTKILAQRERKNIDRFLCISRSNVGPRRRKRNNVQRTGRRNHLLHGRAGCDEPSKRKTSASCSHKSRR
jgi:hypothetical protein